MEERTLCCGCLCAGRRMVLVDEFWEKQSFLQIINEIPIPLTKGDLSLCWECEALLKSFTRFKKQVKECYKLLNDYAEQNISTTVLQRAPRLAIHNTSHIQDHLYAEQELSDTPDIVKTELDSPVKEEDNISTYSDNLNDDTIVEVKVKKKKKKVPKERKKKKKKEAKLIREVELNAEELDEERKMLANKEEYVNAMFRCEKCILPFPNADDLKDHLNIKHDPNKSYFKCNVCECTFTTEVSYNYHTNKHRRRYECAACGERVKSKGGAMKHYEITHCARYECGACVERVKGRGAATRHYEITHCASTELDYSAEVLHENGQINETQEPNDESAKKDTIFPCEFCDKTFRWKTSLRKHVETHRIETGQKRKPYCEPCRLSFTTTSNLQKHVKTSSKHQIQLKLWKLKESLPPDTTSLEKHQAHIEQIKCSVNTSRQTYPCAQCGKRFQWRGNLARHALSHKARANGELVCVPCNRTFSSIATYKQHMKISKKHVSENDFKYMCSDCGKRFANKTRLKDHVDWEHLKNFVHTCDVCQKVFKSHTSLYLHKQVVHKKDSAEHLCDHCGKHFPNKAKLRSHIIALHSSSAPYKCSICCARFSWHSCLSRHARRVHRNRDPPTVTPA